MNRLFSRTKTRIILVSIMVMVAALSFSLISCIKINVESLKGSGDVTTQAFDIDEFDSIDFSGIGKIELKQGDNTSLEVEAEKNIINALKVETRGNELKIGIKRGYINIIPTKEVIFRLTAREVERIKLTGAGIINCDSFEAQRLLIDSSGLGSINMDLSVEDLEVSISGAGKVEVAGNAANQEVNISGVGSYSAENLISKVCEIDISGAGKASVNVTDTLDINLSGIGNVEYKGNPSITQNISGAGGTVKSAD